MAKEKTAFELLMKPPTLEELGRVILVPTPHPCPCDPRFKCKCITFMHALEDANENEDVSADPCSSFLSAACYNVVF